MKSRMENSNPAYTKEPWRVGNYHSCVVSDTPIDGVDSESSVEYYGGHCICESCTDANADRIVACINACKDFTNEQLEKFTINPYVHDLEQQIELLEQRIDYMQLELQQAEVKVSYNDFLEEELLKARGKATAYDRLMSGGKKTLKEWANIFGLPFAVGLNGQGIAFKCKNLPVAAGNNWWPTDVGDFGFAFIDSSFIDYSGDWKDSLTLPDGWEER